MVLRILNKSELEQIVDDDAQRVINHFIDKAVELQPELRIGQEERPIQIPKEHIEQWFVQALGVDPVGAGSYPVDVIRYGEFAADIKMLSCKVDRAGRIINTLSGEASLGQKFEDGDVTLDELFAKKRKDEIVEKWKKILVEKYATVYKEKNINIIYYFFLLRAGMKFYVCGCSLNEEELVNISSSRMTNDSVFIDGYIDSVYGDVKIYKAKKRMELRLRPEAWVKNGKTMEFTTTKKIGRKNLRGTF